MHCVRIRFRLGCPTGHNGEAGANPARSRHCERRRRFISHSEYRGRRSGPRVVSCDSHLPSQETYPRLLRSTFCDDRRCALDCGLQPSSQSKLSSSIVSALADVRSSSSLDRGSRRSTAPVGGARREMYASLDSPSKSRPPRCIDVDCHSGDLVACGCLESDKGLCRAVRRRHGLLPRQGDGGRRRQLHRHLPSLVQGRADQDECSRLGRAVRPGAVRHPPAPTSRRARRRGSGTVPVSSLYSASTTHLSLLVDLQRLDVLTGVSTKKFLIGDEILKRAGSAQVREFAAASTIDTELVVSQRPGLFMTASTTSTELSVIRRASIPVVANNEWLEPTALARGEWLKYMALFLNEERRRRALR